MDELIQEMLRGPALGTGFELWEAVFALVLSFLLCLMIAYFYRETHHGLSYSVSFVHTMIIMGVTVSIIMLIIGSNIARAFALVGALSIIRFRTAVKESRDVAFIFVTMAIGMATGTRFYPAAVVFTLFTCGMVYFLARFEIGGLKSREMLLRVDVASGFEYHSAFNEVFYRFVREHALLSVESVKEGKGLELVYAVQLKRPDEEGPFLDGVRSVAGDGKVALLTGQEGVIA